MTENEAPQTYTRGLSHKRFVRERNPSDRVHPKSVRTKEEASLSEAKGDKIALFQGKKIRRKWDEKTEKWWFSVVDIISALTNSENPHVYYVYWRVIKKRLIDEGSDETVTKCNALKMIAADGKMRLTDVADTETMFRIIQSIPSPNTEPFKLWLARVGYERVEEVNDPELAINRSLKTYLKKGYSPQWINLRLKSIEIRKDLTDEWIKGGVKRGCNLRY